jgi:hypothetical protein
MIFKTKNLDGLTCIQNFEVLYKWQIGLKKEKTKRVEFEFESDMI